MNKMIRAVEATKQNATLGRARESLSTEEIFGGEANEKRGPQKISGGGIQDRKQSKSGCSEERQPRVVEDGRRCGNQSGDEAGRRNMGGKAPTVGQDTVDTVLCCRG